MPLTQQQKDWVVTQSGYSPSTHQLDDDGYISEKTTTQPAVLSNGLPQPKLTPAGPAPMGMGSTFVKEAIHAAPATAMGGLGAWGGAALGAPLAPVTAGLSIPIGAILGGFGLGMGTSLIQDKIEEAVVPDYVAQRQANLAANPVTGMAARLATMPLGGMNFSPSNLGRAGGDALSRVTGATSRLNPAQTANLANVGIGAGLGTGIGVGTQLAQGRPLGETLTSLDTLEALIGGAAFNKPNAIGKRYGWHDVPASAPRITDDPRIAAIQAELARTKQAAGKATPTPEQQAMIDLAGRGLYEKKEGKAASLDRTDILTANQAAEQRGINPTKAAAMEAQRVREAGLLTPEDIYQQKVRKELERAASARRKADFEKATLELQQQAAQAQAETAQAQALKQELKQRQQLQMKLGVQATPEAILGRGITMAPENRPATPRGNNKRIAAMEADPVDPFQDAADDIQTRLERKNQPEGEAVAEDSELRQAVVASKANTPLDDFAKTLFDARAQEMGADVGKTTEKGSFALLADKLKRMAASIGTAEGADTRAHEVIGHIYNKMLELSPYESDKRIQRQMLKAAAESPELKAINERRAAAGKEAWAPDEFVANQQGLEWLMRNAAGETPNKAWFEQWKAGMKSVMGKANAADLRRLVDYKWHNDAPFAEYFGIKAAGDAAAKAGARVNQDYQEGMPELKDTMDSQSTKLSDANFNVLRISQDLNALLKAKDIPTNARLLRELASSLHEDQTQVLLKNLLGDLDVSNLVQKHAKGLELIRVDNQRKRLIREAAFDGPRRVNQPEGESLQPSKYREMTDEEFNRHEYLKKAMTADQEVWDKKLKEYVPNKNYVEVTKEMEREFSELEDKAWRAKLVVKAQNDGPNSRAAEELANLQRSERRNQPADESLPFDEGFNSKEGDDIFSNNEDIEVNDALPVKMTPPPEGYRRVKIVSKDGATREVFFNDKFYPGTGELYGQQEDLASFATMGPNGLSHGVTRPGDKIVEMPDQLYRRDQPADEALRADKHWNNVVEDGWADSIPWNSKEEMQADVAKLKKVFEDSNSNTLYYDEIGLSKKQLAFLRSGGLIDAQLSSPPYQVTPLFEYIKRVNQPADEALPSTFEGWNKYLKWTSKVTDPTPDSLQYLMKYDGIKSRTEQMQDNYNAVLSGRKPIAAFYREPQNVPEGLEVRRISNANAEAHVGSFAVIKKGNINAFNELMRAVASRDSDAVGKALGYSEQETAEFKDRSSKMAVARTRQEINDRMSGRIRRDQPADEALPAGRKRTKEEHVAQQKERNRIARAQNAALRHQAGDVLPPEQVATNMKGDLGEMLNKTGRPANENTIPKSKMVSLDKPTEAGKVGDVIGDKDVAFDTAKLDQNYNDMHVRVTQKLKELNQERIHAIEDHGERSDVVEELDSEIAIQQKLQKWIETQDPTARVDLKGIKKVYQPEGEALAARARQINSPEFKRWFGDSKVVDPETGKPKLLLHLSKAGGFNEFKANMHFGTEDQAMDIFNARNDPDYTQGENPVYNLATYPVYLSIKNPKPVRDMIHVEGWNKAIKAAKEEGYDGLVYKNEAEGSATFFPSRENIDSIKPGQWAIERRFNDFILVKDKQAGEALFNNTIGAKVIRQLTETDIRRFKVKNKAGENLSYVAFYPEQIKSATGNSGAFDPKNPDIRYQPEGEALAARKVKLVKQYHDAVKEIKAGDQRNIGYRNVVAADKSYKVGWSNGSEQWEVGAIGAHERLAVDKNVDWNNPTKMREWREKHKDVLNRIFAKKGEEIQLDSNQILVASSNRKDAEFIAQHLPEPPFAINAAERNPLLNRDLDFEQALEAYKDLTPNKIDVVKETSSFLDRVNQPAEEALAARERQINSPEFKRWFGDSKVVDKDGRPLVVCHYSSDEPPTVFDRDAHFGTIGQAMQRMVSKVLPHYVSVKDVTAKLRGKPTGVAIDDIGSFMPVYLSIKNPLRVPDLNHSWLSGSTWADYLNGRRSRPHANDPLPIPPELRAALEKRVKPTKYNPGGLFANDVADAFKEAGIDGFVYRNEGESDVNSFRRVSVNSTNQADSYLAFYPEQIKSAIGNSGAFDAANPDIRYQPEGEALPTNQNDLLRNRKTLQHFIKNDKQHLDELINSPVIRLFGDKNPEGGMVVPDSNGEFIKDTFGTYFVRVKLDTKDAPSYEPAPYLYMEQSGDLDKALRWQPAEEALPSTIYERTGAVGKGVLHTVGAEVDKLKSISPAAGKGAEDFLTALRARRGELEGSFNYALRQVRKAQTLKEYWFQDNPDYQKVVQWRDAMQDGDAEPFALTATQKAINDVVDANLKRSLDLRESFKKEGDIDGLARGTAGKKFYLPHVMARDVATTLAETPTSAKAAKLLEDFISYRTEKSGQTAEEARADWNTIRNSFNMVEEGNIASRFGAIDKALGKGLPKSMREQNLMDRMGRFNRRFARRVAFHEAIQRNTEARDAFFNSEKGVASSKVGKNILRDMFGIREHTEATRSAASGIVRALMLGPLTGAKDIVSGQVLGLQHMGLEQVLPAKMEAFAKFGENYKKAIETGVVRNGYGGLESGEGGLSNVQAVMERIRDVINQVQGRQMLETVSRVMNYGEGQFLAADAFRAIENGRLSAQQRGFLDDFVPNWQELKNKPVDGKVLDEAAARFVESVQGTYDYRGLPSVAMQGTFSPYLSLARWNIEKFNNFTKKVVDPATKGNYRPLLMATLGAFIGGTAVNALVEEVTGRKERTAKWDEIAASKEQTGLIGYKLAALASMSGYGGILGDIVKSGFDAKYKNRVQTFSNPLIDAGATVLEDTKFLVQAMEEGDLPAVTDVLNLLATDYIQAWRIALPHVSGEKKKELEATNKRRDLKVWKMGEGEELSAASNMRPNPLVGKAARQFKQTDDMQEAAGLVPELVDKAIAKATIDGTINPEILKEELSKYKRNSYQTVPNPEQSPISATRYIDFLSKTQGRDEASRRIEDYMRRNAINKAKSSMIPTIQL